MTTPEQQAREMLERMGIEGAQNMSAGDVGELANFISRSDALLLELHKALDEFKIIDEMNDQLREQNTAVDEACAKLEKENDALKAELDAIKQEAPSNRPATPLTDEQIDELLERERQRWSSRTGPPTYEFALAFARAIEAAHGIKGA